MKAVSPAFLAALAESHPILTDVRLVGPDSAALPVIDGSVTVSAQAGVRTRATLSFSDESLVPLTAGDVLAPYGNEVEIRQGVVLSDGSTEWVSHGILGIDETSISESGDGVGITVECFDRASRIGRARTERPVPVATDTPLSELVERLLTDAWPDVPLDLEFLPWTTPKGLIDHQVDPWEEAQRRALDGGAQLYFDDRGFAKLTTARTDQPVASYVEGEGGLLLSAARKLGRDNVYNRWIARGENPEASVRGVATDDNPLSPTFYDGPFGHVPKFYESAFIRTSDQAITAALEMMAREIGLREQIEFGGILNPALEPDDFVTVRRPKLGIDSVFALDELTFPLTPGASMSAKCREQVVS